MWGGTVSSGSKFRLRFGVEHKIQKALGYLVMRVDLGKDVEPEDPDILRFYYDFVVQKRERHRVIGAELEKVLKPPKVVIEFGDFDRPVPSRRRLLGSVLSFLELLQEGLG